MYIDKLVDIVNEYNNTYHRTIEMKLINLKSNTFIDFGLGNDEKDSKLVIVDPARMYKYKNIFVKLQIGLKKFL